MEYKDIMIILLKIIIFFLAFFLLYSLSAVFCYGRKCASVGDMHLDTHRKYVKRAFWGTIILVLMVETLLQLAEYGARNEKIFLLHMFFVAVFSISLVLLRFFYTGISNRAYHKPIAYICFTAFLVVLSTGAFMISGFV